MGKSRRTYFVCRVRICEIENLDVALRGGDHHERVLNIHAVATLRKLDGGNRGRSPHIPVLVIT